MTHSEYWVPGELADEFSWCACDRCNSPLGGARYGAWVEIRHEDADDPDVSAECEICIDCYAEIVGYSFDDIGGSANS